MSKEIKLKNVVWGVLVGVAVISFLIGGWYYYFLYRPLRTDVNDILRIQQMELDFQDKYCVGGEYANDFIREFCKERTSPSR